MKQRLGIAQALLNRPQLLVLDEPTAGLDPKERVRFRNLIGEAGKEGIVILSTHIVSDIEHIADKVLMMKDGQLIFQESGRKDREIWKNFIWSSLSDGRNDMKRWEGPGFRTLYLYELKKIIYRRSVWITSGIMLLLCVCKLCGSDQYVVWLQ